jgi:prolipoprotein diacylglyceryltransferase
VAPPEAHLLRPTAALAALAITDPELFKGQWHKWFSIWEGGLGIWGSIALGAAAGLWVAKRRDMPLLPFLDCAARALAGPSNRPDKSAGGVLDT